MSAHSIPEGEHPRAEVVICGVAVPEPVKGDPNNPESERRWNQLVEDVLDTVGFEPDLRAECVKVTYQSVLDGPVTVDFDPKRDKLQLTENYVTTLQIKDEVVALRFCSRTESNWEVSNYAVFLTPVLQVRLRELSDAMKRRQADRDASDR